MNKSDITDRHYSDKPLSSKAVGGTKDARLHDPHETALVPATLEDASTGGGKWMGRFAT